MSQPSVQLYSVRDAIDHDLDGAVARVAEIGFTRVEPYAFHLRTDDYRRAFAASGLTAPTGHAAVIGRPAEYGCGQIRLRRGLSQRNLE